MFPATAAADDDTGCWVVLLLLQFCSTSRAASAAENRSFSDLVRLCDMVVGSIVCLCAAGVGRMMMLLCSGAEELCVFVRSLFESSFWLKIFSYDSLEQELSKRMPRVDVSLRKIA